MSLDLVLAPASLSLPWSHYLGSLCGCASAGWQFLIVECLYRSVCVLDWMCVCKSCVRLIRARQKSRRADIFLPLRLSPVAAVPELCDICSLTGSLCCKSQRLTLPKTHTFPYCSSIQLHQVNYLRQRAVFTIPSDTFWFPSVCVCMNTLNSRLLLGFYHRITGGMLMTKPNYRGLITATFTKLITAKRRKALQVIHYVGY